MEYRSVEVQHKSNAFVAGEVSFESVKEKLQQQNKDMVIIPIGNSAAFDLLVPKHKTGQCILKKLEGLCALYTISLNTREIVYLFDKQIGYLAKEVLGYGFE